MIKSRRKLSDKGFTILELMLAMTVFSVILVAAAASLIQIGRMYYKSVITTRTQDTTRAITDEITRSIQFSGDTPIINTGEDYGGTEVRAVCIGNVRYSYTINLQLGVEVSHVLWRDEQADAACTPADLTTNLVDGVELMGENMRLTRFDIANVESKEYALDVGVAYGDSDLLVGITDTGDIVDYDDVDAVRVNCLNPNAGAEFCSVSELATLVTRRL